MMLIRTIDLWCYDLIPISLSRIEKTVVLYISSADFSGSKIHVCLTGFCEMFRMQNVKYLEFAKYFANSIT